MSALAPVLDSLTLSVTEETRVRASLDANAPNALMLVTPGKGSDFQRRQAAGAATVSQPGTTTAKAPWWVKLERIGDTFNAYESADGATT